MNTENLTWIAAAGLIATCWRQCIGLFQRLRSFVVVKTVLRGDVSKAVIAYLWRNYKRSPFNDRVVQSNSAFVRPLSRMQEVAWDQPPIQPMIFLKGWKPILLGGLSGHMPGSGGASIPDSGVATLTTIRGLVDVETLIIAALDEFNQQRGQTGDSRYRVRRVQGFTRRRGMNGDPESQATMPMGGSAPDPYEASGAYLKWKRDEIGSAVAENPMGALAIPPALKSHMDEFTRWKESEKWFRARQIPWRRGWLLYGRPGTGKTSIVRALAQKADMPIWNFDLSSLSNEEMVQNWREMQESAPCIALFEDIDAVFKGRENLLGEQGGGLTFDCLLNCLGGIETCDGIFTIITTNHVESIDPALGIPQDGVSSRPGRLDRAIEMPDLSADCLRQIAKRILGDWPEIIDGIVSDHLGYTGAQFTEICVQEALSRYWCGSPPHMFEAKNGSRPPHLNGRSHALTTGGR